MIERFIEPNLAAPGKQRIDRMRRRALYCANDFFKCEWISGESSQRSENHVDMIGHDNSSVNAHLTSVIVQAMGQD